MTTIVGWDIGGANLKAARVEGEPPAVTRVLERPFALWREPSALRRRLEALAVEIGRADRHALTMTAELCDCFASKAEGVRFVLDAFLAALPGSDLALFGADGRFRSPAAARARPLRIAAANWRATAELVAEAERDALLLDVGSTTSDVVPIVGGRVVARGRTDPQRLRSGELVFTGALRTPVCAIARRLPYRGRPCRVAAEWFAIAADAHLWLGHLGAADYTCDTPDGRGISRAECGARLARMIAADAGGLAEADITALAQAVFTAQVRAIAGGLRQVLRRLGPAAPRRAVLAGQGLFLARAAAVACGLEAQLLALDPHATRAAPAAAVALLLARRPA